MLILLEASGGMMGTADGGIIGGVGLEDTLNKFVMAPLLGIAGGSFGIIGGFFLEFMSNIKLEKI